MTNAAPWLPRLTIDLDALVHNYRQFCAQSRGSVAAVVKANAYGLGVGAVAEALYDDGCRQFFTAHVSEGVELRRLLGAEADIFLMVPHPAVSLEEVRRNRLTPVVYSREMLTQLAADDGQQPVALHVETGIHRLAFDADEWASIRPDVLPTGVDVVLMMSHLATADEHGSPLTEEQRRRFAEQVAGWPGVPASLANSAGAALDTALHFDMVRPGIALFGAAPGPAGTSLKTVARFSAPVLQIRELPPGVSVGYGASALTSRPTRLAVLAAGYADGIPRLAGQPNGSGERAAIGCGEHRFAYFGRVSMDLVAVDVTDAPTGLVEVGTRFDVFGGAVSIGELASHCQTITYELLTGIGGRTQRVYRGTGDDGSR
ncbi:MAG: alanine racemase [Pseudomonadota bacterium]